MHDSAEKSEGFAYGVYHAQNLRAAGVSQHESLPSFWHSALVPLKPPPLDASCLRYFPARHILAPPLWPPLSATHAVFAALGTLPAGHASGGAAPPAQNSPSGHGLHDEEVEGGGGDGEDEVFDLGTQAWPLSMNFHSHAEEAAQVVELSDAQYGSNT